MTVLATDYTDLITQQHNTCTKFMAMVGAWSDAYAHVQNIMASISPALDPAIAVGHQQDMVAEWVGVSRDIPTPITGYYFELSDEAEPTKTGVGFGQWKSSTDPATTMSRLNDEMFTRAIAAKIKANQWKGDHDTAYDIARAALGDDVTIQITDRPTIGSAVNEDTVDNDITITVNPDNLHSYNGTIDNDLAITEHPGIPYYAATVGNQLTLTNASGTELYYWCPETVGSLMLGTEWFYPYPKMFTTSYPYFGGTDKPVGTLIVIVTPGTTYSVKSTYRIIAQSSTTKVYVEYVSGTVFSDGFVSSGTYWGKSGAFHEPGEKKLVCQTGYFSTTGGDYYINKTLNILDDAGDVTCTLKLKRFYNNARVQADILTGSIPAGGVITGGDWALSTESTTTPGTGNYILTPETAYFSADNEGDTINVIDTDGTVDATFEVLDYLLDGTVIASLETGSLPSSPIAGGEWDFSTVTQDTTGDYIITAESDYFDDVGIESLDIMWFNSGGFEIVTFAIVDGVSATVVWADFLSGDMPTLPQTIAGGEWMLEGDTLTLDTATIPNMLVTITGATELQQALFTQKIIPLKPAGVAITYVFI